ncbi:MAG: hypothetical protein Kow00109_17280 [Acidobacteriota bacterium]
MTEEDLDLRREVEQLRRGVRTLRSLVDAWEPPKAVQEPRPAPEPALILEALGAAWWEQDFANGKVCRSPLWMRMLGYEPEEIPPELNAWKELIHPEDLPAALHMAQLHERGERPVFEVLHRLRTKEGGWRWILNRGRIVEWDRRGRPLRAVGAHVEVPVGDRGLAGEVRLQRAETGTLRLPDAFLAVCAGCKKVRDPRSEWLPIDEYLLERHNVQCTHGICPECAARLYPEFSGNDRERKPDEAE